MDPRGYLRRFGSERHSLIENLKSSVQESPTVQVGTLSQRPSKKSLLKLSKRSVTSRLNKGGAASQWDNKLRPALQDIRKKMDHDVSTSLLLLDSDEEEEWDETQENKPAGARCTSDPDLLSINEVFNNVVLN